MVVDHQSGSRFFARWVGFTFLGWLLGFVLTVILAVSWESIGLGTSQFMVGVGMGAGVGFMQGLIIKRWTGEWRRWFFSSIVGLGAVFVVFDLFGGIALQGSDSFALIVPVAAGGLLAGCLQWFVLRAHGNRAGWWPLSCMIAWLLAAWLATAPLLSGKVSGTSGALLQVGLILLGGVVLGLFTGATLVVMKPAWTKPTK